MLSVSDKRGIEDLGRQLTEAGVEIVSTGGTGRALAAAGVAYRPVQDATGVPEMLNGRVKTLHPVVLGGILFQRNVPEHRQAVEEHHLCPIDLVVVNLYPFTQTIAKPGCTPEEATEQIDIGGPTMVRSAAKNHADVAVVVDPDDYPELTEQIRETGGTAFSFRRRLMTKAFAHTSQYDAAIAKYFTSLA